MFGPALAGLLAGCAAPDGSTGAGSQPVLPGYRVVADLPLPGGTSRWGYQVLDGRAGRLYVAHPGAGQVVVVDTAQLRVAATVPDIDTVQGLALAPVLGRLYASATSRNEIAVIELASARVVARVTAGSGPDSLTYVSESGSLLVSDAAGTGETVVDVKTHRPRARVELGTGLGDSQYDSWTGRVLVAVGGREELVALDPASAAVIARYRLPGCQEAHGVRMDVSSTDRAFVACAGNARLLAVDLATGRVSAPLEVGTGPDELALDPALHRLYVASQSGLLTVVDTAGPDPVVLVRGDVGPNAHSVAVDPDTHLLYLPVANVGGRPVLRVLAPL